MEAKQRLTVISSGISLINWQESLEQVAALALQRRSSYMCFANVHMVVEAHLDKAFAQILKEADMVFADGMPIVKALKWLYGIRQERITGMDFLPRVLAEAERRGITVFFYGGTEEVMQGIAKRARRELPKLNIAGMISPPFRVLSSEEQEEMIARIQAAQPGIVLVALGCPRQEKWMAQQKGKIAACMIGVGGAFPVYAGVQQRAPKWMQDASLEWAYRLALEPRRLFKRYFVTNSNFLYLLVEDYLRQKLKRNVK